LRESEGMGYLRKATAVIFLMAMSAGQYGCLAAAWVAAVCTDSLRTGHVQFQPFENSWVSPGRSDAIADHSGLTSLALMPVDGDEAMGTRLYKLFLHETTLRVLMPEMSSPADRVAGTDQERAVLAREVSRALAVDAVLYGHVVCAAPHSSTWGWKTQESRRLFLYMMDREGNLLWKDELPFLVVTGQKPALEGSVQLSLTRHFMDHAHALRLDEAGYFPSKPL
jgi:hypothetical protein